MRGSVTLLEAKIFKILCSDKFSSNGDFKINVQNMFLGSDVFKGFLVVSSY